MADMMGIGIAQMLSGIAGAIREENAKFGCRDNAAETVAIALDRVAERIRNEASKEREA